MAKSPIRPRLRKDGEAKPHSYQYGYSNHGREQRERRLNIPLFLTTLLVLIISIPAIYFWHNYQTKKLSESLWQYGKELAAQGRYGEASDAMYRVWEIQRDPELLGEAVQIYDKYAVARDREGVIAAYQTAIGGLPERTDLRVRLVELLTRNQQFSTALDQSEKVLEADPENLAGKKWRALSLLGLRRIQQSVDGYDVLEELKKTYINQQKDFDIAAALVSHIRDDLKAQNESELAIQADGVMNRLVAANPNNVNARLVRYQYRVRHKLPGAKQDLDQAVMLAPENPEVVKPAAWSALRDAAANWKAADYLTARELFKRLIKISPEDESGYLGLGDAEYLIQGNVASAIRVWTEGRKKVGDSLPLLLRIAEGQTNSLQFEAVEQTLNDVDALVASLPAAAAERNRNWAMASAAMLRGKVLLRQQQRIKAIDQFRIAADLGTETTTSPTSIRKSDASTAFTALISLGQIYFDLGRFKQAASSYERALLLDPDSEIAMLQGAEAWAEVGDLDRAIRNIEKARRLPKPSVDVTRAHAQYLLEKQLGTPADERNWSDFRDALASVRFKMADSWQLRLLEADYAIHRKRVNQSDYSEAMGKLLAIEQDFPDELEVWKRLPFVYESLGMPADADRALNHLEQLSSSSAETKLLVSDLLLGRNLPDRAQQVLDSVSKMELAPEQILAREQGQLRVLEYLANDQDIDVKLIDLRKDYPNYSLPIERLLDRRLSGSSVSRNPSNLELIEDLKKRQPESESTWEYYAARLELQREAPDLPKLQQYLSSLTNKLPYWSRTQELAGRISHFEGNARDASHAFNSAISKPNRNPELVRLVLDENNSKSDFLANIRILEDHRQIPTIARIISNGTWSQLKRELSFSQVDRGIQKSGSPSIMWNALLEKPDGESEGLENLIVRLWKTDQQDTATVDDLVNEIETLNLGDPDLRAFVLGQSYQLAGRFEAAKRQFNQVVDASERRLRAEIYASAATNQILMRRAREFELAESEAGSTKRLEAIVKLRRATKRDFQEARKLFQSLVASYGKNSDRLLLAMCLERMEEYEQAQQQLETVVESEPSAQNIATLADFLLKQGENDKAQVWLEQLEGQTGWQKKTVMLRVRWLAATNRQQEIKPYVEMYAAERFRRTNKSMPKEMQDIAAIYKSVNQVEDAERWLNMLVNRFPDQSEPLSLLLVEKDETDRAVQRCIDQLNSDPNPETATLLARIAVYGEVDSETTERITPILTQCRKLFPNSASLLFALGNLHIKLNQTEEAIAALSSVTRLQPGHYLAWNNLAALLAEQEGREEEAMETINTAIKHAAYEIPTLMDTKAVVLMHQKKYEAAAVILRNKVTKTRAGADPRFFFHLAISLDRINEPEAALEALRNATEMELENSFLTEFEKSELGRLTRKLVEKQ